jgi:hypothetical protein
MKVKLGEEKKNKYNSTSKQQIHLIINFAFCYIYIYIYLLHKRIITCTNVSMQSRVFILCICCKTCFNAPYNKVIMQVETKLSTAHSITSVFSNMRFSSWFLRHVLGCQVKSQCEHRCNMLHYCRLFYSLQPYYWLQRKTPTFTNLISLLQEWDW